MTTKINSSKDTLCSVSLLPQLAPNWPYAKHLLIFGGDIASELAQTELINRYQQSISVTNYAPAPEINDIAKHTADIKAQNFCVVLCANSLNTSKELDSTLTELALLDFNCCVIQIDEGNGTGKGRKNSNSHQRNERVTEYIIPIQQHFPAFDITLHRSDKCITIVKGQKYFEQDK